MTTEMRPSFGEKVSRFKEQHFPLIEKSELVDATYEVPDLGPWDMNLAGIPKFGKIAVVMVLAASYVVAIYSLGRIGYLHGPMLERAIAVAVVFGFVVTAGFMWVLISLNTGTFSRYVRVIDYRWLHADRRPPRKGEFRVKRITQLWPMGKDRLEGRADTLIEEMFEDIEIESGKTIFALPHVGPKTEPLLKAAGFDHIKKVAMADIEDLTKIKGINESRANDMIVCAQQILVDEEERQVEESQAEAIKKDEEIMDLATREIGSLYRLEQIIKRTRGAKAKPAEKTPIRDAMTLKQDFIRIVSRLNSEWVYSIMECEPDLYILVISQYPLSGGDDPHSGFVEFRDNPTKQRTFIYQDTNPHGTWGVFVHLADYKYLEIPADEYLLMGVEERVKYAPIAYLSYSDGQAEEDVEKLRMQRDVPSGSDQIQAELVYDVTVAERLLELNKLLTAQVSRLRNSMNEIWEEAQEWAKGVIAKAVEMIVLEGKLRQAAGLRTWFVNLFSSKGMKFLMYAIAIFGLYVIVAFAISSAFPTVDIWPFLPDDGGFQPNQPAPYEP